MTFFMSKNNIFSRPLIITKSQLFNFYSRIANYGFTKLIDLIDAIPDVASITKDEFGKLWLQLHCQKNVASAPQELFQLRKHSVEILTAKQKARELDIFLLKAKRTTDQFAKECAMVLQQHNKKSPMPLDNFIPNFHHLFGRQCR